MTAVPVDPDEYLAEPEADYETEPATAATLDEADRHLWRIGVLRREAAEVERLFDDRLKTLAERKAEALAPYELRIAWHERCAEGWMRAHHAETGTKSKKLPAGQLKLTKNRSKVDGATPPETAPESLVRVTRAWDKAKAAKLTVPGPQPIDQTDDYWVHAAIDADGCVVEGLTHLIPKAAQGFTAVTE
jgi:hypothetical protein